MKMRKMWIGSIVLVGVILTTSVSYANADWGGPGWYVVEEVAIGRTIDGGPFGSQDACVAWQNAHPSPLPDARMNCISFASEDAYFDYLLG
jgi:hypothetical protein